MIRFRIKVLYCVIFFSFDSFSQISKQPRAWFKVTPLAKILQRNSSIKVTKCLQNIFYDFESFPPSSLYPSSGYCSSCFILEIPQGKVQGIRGDVFINNYFIKEMAYGGLWQLLLSLPLVSPEKIQKISGRVAVISQDLAGYYFHWIQDILGRLALLEINGIEYDYLYVPYDKKYMKETLELWGIDSKKIISPTGPDFCIEADELIVPSLVVNKNQGVMRYAGFHNNPITMRYVADKLLQAALKKNIDISKFCRKIFISRKDAFNKRRILNEDKIFKMFAKKGFKRYELSSMSVAEQILLFQQADIIVGEHGAGLTNCLFCKSGTKIIEIFQKLIDSCFWWITQVMDLDYMCIQTVPVNGDYFAHYGVEPIHYRTAWAAQTNVPFDKIKKIAKKL